MDREPSSRLVPQELAESIRKVHEQLVAAWDRRYPDNPVRGHGE